MKLLIVLDRLSPRTYRAIINLDWRVFIGLGLLHMAVTYALMWRAGEAFLDPVTFWYWYATTASTIGFGDISPSTQAGRLACALWVYPGALFFFTSSIAKGAEALRKVWSKIMDGFGNFSSETGHTLIIGFHPRATRRIIADLVAGGISERSIFLLETEKPDFDMGETHFIKAEDLTDEKDLLRSGLKGAANILVFANSDEETLTAALSVSGLRPDAGVVASFECDTKAALLRAHTTIRTVSGHAPEIVASEVLDPGLAEVFNVLSRASEGVTAFAMVPDIPGLTLDCAERGLKVLGARFIGLRPATGGDIDFTPEEGLKIAGDTLYYISRARIPASEFAKIINTCGKA